MFKHAIAGACSCIILSSAAYADNRKSPTDHAPLGVMGDHTHKKGEWMASYKYKTTHSSGLRNGNRSVSNNSVLSAYGEAAIKMDMDMHMFEAMVGLTDALTLMVMPQYMQMGMTHKSNHGGGHSHEHTVEGPGDTEVAGLYSFYHVQDGASIQRAHINAGVSLPTGSIDENFADHHNNIYRMPYNMQFGSGTFDPIIGATYTSSQPDWSWGAQTLNYIRLGKNNNGYRQGNKYTATAWAARNLADFLSASFRLEAEAWGDVSGRDRTLPRNIIAGADPNEQAGERIMAHIGLNLMAGEGALTGQRLAAEIGLPLYERYSGPQPDTAYRLSLGWQFAF